MRYTSIKSAATPRRSGHDLLLLHLPLQQFQLQLLLVQLQVHLHQLLLHLGLRCRSQVPVLVFYALGFNTMNTMNHKVPSKILQIYHLSLFEAHWRALDREYCRLQPEEFINFLNIDICVDAKWRHSKSKMQLDSRQLDTQSVKQITTMGFHST